MFKFLKRAFLKLVWYPARYGRKQDYNASQYWHDRFEKYGDSILGPGNDAHTEEHNLKMYADAKEVFLKHCCQLNIPFSKARICEIGLGTGFYTQILKENGVVNYQGYDISDVVVSNLSKKYPDYKFGLKDVSSEPIEGCYDVILLIDVVQHIVNDAKFEYTMRNIAKSLSPGGKLLIGPLGTKNVKLLFYVRAWTIQDVKKAFSEKEFTISEPVTFRNGTLYTVCKK